MGSRSYIGYLNDDDGNVTFSYCHKGAAMKYNGVALIDHFNTEKEAKDLAFHGEMSEIDHEDGTIYGYNQSNPPATVSLKEYIEKQRIESLFLWRDAQWHVKSDWHLHDNNWYLLSDQVLDVGDRVYLVRDNYIKHIPKPVWKIHRITEEDVFIVRREVLPGNFQSLHMQRREIYPISTARKEELKSRISQLCEMSADLEHYYEKLVDDDSDLEARENEYQDLFILTVQEFGR